MVINLNTLEKKYNSLITEYNNLEEIKLNLFNNLSNVYNMDWKDGNSYNFGQDIEKDRLEIDSVLMNVESKIRVYEYIYNKYSYLGKKIKVNYNQKAVILSSIDTCINQINSINSQFDSMDLNFGYPEFGILRTKKSNYAIMKSNLVTIRDEYETLFTRVEEIENEIATVIRELEYILISEYTFDFTEKSDYTIGATLIENAYEINLGKIEFYSSEENGTLTKIYNTLNCLGAFYVSANVNSYQNKLFNLKQCIRDLDSKRTSYMNTLNTVPSLYGIAIKKTEEIFKEENNE